MVNLSNGLDPNAWILSYADELYNYAMRKTSQSAIAEDLVQETFLAGLKSSNQFKGNSSERTWLFSILKFKIADYYRKAATKFEFSSSSFDASMQTSNYQTYFDEDGVWREGTAPKDWLIAADQSFENKALGLALNQCIEKLPTNQKQLILRKLVEEEDTKTVCKELNLSTTNYWVIIHRAKLQLRACLEKNWFNA